MWTVTVRQDKHIESIRKDELRAGTSATVKRLDRRRKVVSVRNGLWIRSGENAEDDRHPCLKIILSIPQFMPIANEISTWALHRKWP
ncbi:MAG: hypothetical protein OXC72_13590 [Roseovarius sp.]|nr:hypothetical protein [Roseovarius sp.]